MGVRRVVTGQTAAGAAFVSDEVVEPATLRLMPGAGFLTVWGDDAPPELPADGSPPDAPTWFPLPGGYRFCFITLPPAGAAPPDDLDMDAAVAEMREKLPGLAEVFLADSSGFHQTPTVDLCLIVAGEVWLELESGDRTLLRAGDTAVQNGTRHGWKNEADVPCTMMCVVLASR